MKKALEKFDWAAVLAHLPDNGEESLKKLLTDITRTGVLIRVFSLSESKEKRRAQFIEELKVFVSGAGVEAADKYLKYLLLQVEITEAALRVIDMTLSSDAFSSFSESHQAWSVLEWASREMLDVHRQSMEGLRASQTRGAVIVDPLTLRLDKAHGEGLADGRIYQLAETAANTLRMLGHRQKWSKSGIFQLPPRVAATASKMEAAERISRLGDVWQDLMDESCYHRFFGGHFEPKDPDVEQLGLMPQLELVFASVKKEDERRDDAQIAEYVAHNRAQRWTLSASRSISRTDAKTRIKNPKIEHVALAPSELVSELELTTLYVLDNIFHWNAVKSSDEIKGLTILEWLRGYSVLEESYAGGFASKVDAMIEVDPDELHQTLQRAGMTATKAGKFVELVTFSKGRRDLYDAPLLQSSDGKFYFLAALYHGINLPLIIASQLGSLNHSVGSKGKTFEKSVLKDFQDAGIPSATFKFKINGVEYDCDVAVLWDHQLIIFECKNYSLPNDDPTERFYFWQKQAEAQEQVRRIASDLSANPQIVKKNLGEDAEWEAVHSVVLNALPFSLRRAPTGTYFYDASALGRFLRTGTLNEVHSIPRPDDEPVDVSFQIKRLWKGKSPAAKDLLKEMKYPSQISMESERYYIARRLLPISIEAALMYHKAASKPPGFQALLTSEQAKELRTLVSRRGQPRRKRRKPKR